jgi:putative hydrolase of the HAD superfamily
VVRSGQVLIFDADDTLWENNVLFERALDDFVDWLVRPSLDRERIRTVFRELEAANLVAHGYGSKVFLGTLADSFEQLMHRPVNDAERRQLDELTAALREQRVELIPGVADTLAALGRRHRLQLLTKGERNEQQRKIDVSGLVRFFEAVDIVPEKDVEAYRRLAKEYGLPVDDTWMIGNSPKSDILPARAAGMNAVFIPNANTWVLEQTELDPSDTGVLELNSFAELTDHF